MLFDLEADPTELHNLLAVEPPAGADTPASETETTRLRLRAKLAVFPVPTEHAPPYTTGGPVQRNGQSTAFLMRYQPPSARR